MLNISTYRTRLIIISVSAIVLVACGRSDGQKSDKDTSATQPEGPTVVAEPPDPVEQKIEADIASPLLFAIRANSGNGVNAADDGIFTNILDNNGNLGSLAPARLVDGTYTLERVRKEGLPSKDFHFQFAPAAQWMAARVLQRLENTALIADRRNSEIYWVPSPLLLSRYVFWFGATYQGRWYYFDLGHFHVTNVERINEFDGPDKQTGAMTKIRSYKVTAEFVPSTTLTAMAPMVSYGTFDWTVALERNPITMDWELYSTGQTTNWNP